MRWADFACGHLGMALVSRAGTSFGRDMGRLARREGAGGRVFQ
jgi:hypothetical protein